MSEDLKYNAWWDELPDTSEYKLQRTFSNGFDEGYSKGHKDAVEYNETCEWYEKRIDQLEQLLAANVRVIKAELSKEIAEEAKKQLREEVGETVKES